MQFGQRTLFFGRDPRSQRFRGDLHVDQGRTPGAFGRLEGGEEIFRPLHAEGGAAAGFGEGDKIGIVQAGGTVTIGKTAARSSDYLKQVLKGAA